MIIGSKMMPQRCNVHVLARAALCCLTMLILWSCASPPSGGDRSGGPTTAAAPPSTPPREQSMTASMMASAKWVDEASRAIDVGDYDRATSLLERALSVEPNNGQAFYYYGLAMGARGRSGAALPLLQKAEILLQGDAQALGQVYAQMGRNLERLGRRQEAIRRYEQALAQDPANTLARQRLSTLRG
jgi:Flp pilus assembly protein TadD